MIGKIQWARPLTRKNLPNLKAEIVKLENEEKISIILDLKSVDAMDSSGLGFLIETMRRLTEKGQRLKLANANPSIGRILGLFGAELVLEGRK